MTAQNTTTKQILAEELPWFLSPAGRFSTSHIWVAKQSDGLYEGGVRYLEGLQHNRSRVYSKDIPVKVLGTSHEDLLKQMFASIHEASTLYGTPEMRDLFGKFARVASRAFSDSAE